MLGEGIAKAVETVGYPVVIVASSDMSHYVPDNIARQKDKKAIDRILSLDPEGLYETVVKERISMCGYLPAITVFIRRKGPWRSVCETREVQYIRRGERRL